MAKSKTEKEPFVFDKSTRYRVELLIILLVVTVLLNILVYYLNREHDRRTFGTPTPTLVPSINPTTSP